MSISPENDIHPKPPLYGPRLVVSSWSINSMAFTFGAPLTVPTGNAARKTSQLVKSSSNSPVTYKDQPFATEREKKRSHYNGDMHFLFMYTSLLMQVTLTNFLKACQYK
uniref:Uncharacterized protein n=1 Tax=Rhizophora mucronata TaxID=61149 RepID=A0A2P2KK33_RHIMU